MEISKVTQNSIKIKSKNATLVTDPSGKTDADIVILTNSEATIPENTKLVIEGPGEYEVGGLSIKGDRIGDTVLYKLFDDQFSVLLVPLSAVSKVKEEDEYDVVIIHAPDIFNKKDVEALSSEIILVYGGQSPTDESVKKLPRVNLKKKEELKGSIVYLG